jgi:hypothetical protein
LPIENPKPERDVKWAAKQSWPGCFASLPTGNASATRLT